MGSAADHIAAWHELVRMRAQNLDEPLTSALPEEEIRLLRRFDDARPVGGRIVSDTDGPFTYIVSVVGEQGGFTTTEWLHQAFLRRLLAIWLRHREAAAALRGAALSDPDYLDAVDVVERWLSSPQQGDPDARPPLLRRLNPKGDKTIEEWGDIFARIPRLSQIPVEHVRCDVAGLSTDPTELPPATDDPEAHNRLGAEWLTLCRAEDMPIELPVAVRLNVALDIWRRRRFVKIRMLEFGWPEVMREVRNPGGLQQLRHLEEIAREVPDPPDLTMSWKRFREDERLREFLRIRPYFTEVFDEDLARVAPSTGPIDSTTAEPVDLSWDPYVDAFLVLSTDRVDLASEHQDASWTGRMMFKTPDGEEGTAQVVIPVGELTARSLQLPSLYAHSLSGGFGREVQPRDLSAAFAGPPPDDEVQDLGRKLWHSTFGSDQAMTERFVKLLTHNRVRLSVSADHPLVSGMPWECLYVPQLRVMVGHTLKVSIVRAVPDQINLTERVLNLPIRLLVAHAQPHGFGPLPGALQEIDLLRRAVAEAEAQGLVSLRVLSSVTTEELAQHLRLFRPHVLHYLGHGTAHGTSGPGLLLQDDSGGSSFLSAANLGAQLQDHGLILAILNGCETGVDPVVAATTHGVCQTIVRQGVPMAVATTRSIHDTAALWFSREFYRALLDAYPVEAAVSEARKALLVKGWDWSAYALYAGGTAHLDEFRLRRPVS